jgi:hypothetical protein
MEAGPDLLPIATSGDAGSTGGAGLRGNGSPDALMVMAAVALIVYERLGLMILKRTWFNVDLTWAGALMVAGVFALVV